MPVINLTDACVAQYKMNDNLADKVVLDAIGGGNGTSIRNTSAMHVTGKIDGALNFNNATDAVDTRRVFETVFQDSFSVNLWYNIATAEAAYLIGLEGPDGFFYIELVIPENTIRVLYKALSSDAVDVFSATRPVGRWVMVTAVVSKVSEETAKIDVYLDGTLSGEGAVGPCEMGTFLQDYYLAIGASNDGYLSWPFLATVPFSVDNLCIFNRVLTQDEIDFLYNSGNGTELLRNDEMATAFIKSDEPADECWQW